jgi:hypothetical protein
MDGLQYKCHVTLTSTDQNRLYANPWQQYALPKMAYIFNDFLNTKKQTTADANKNDAADISGNVRH